MNFAMITNVATMFFCMAVLVQSVRMMRSLRTVKDGALTQVVTALETATTQARAVLSDMKKTLGSDAAANARLIDEAKTLRDELAVMVGIADAAAERIVGAVGLANAGRDVEEDADEIVREEELA